MNNLTSKSLMTMAVAASVSLMALAAPASAFAPIQDTKEDKKVIIKKKDGDKRASTTITKRMIAFMDDDGQEKIVITKKIENGKEVVDIEGGQILSRSEDGNSFVIRAKNGEEHTIKLSMDDSHRVWKEKPSKRMAMKKEWVDDEGKVHVMKGMAPKAGKSMVWSSKGGMKAPMVWFNDNSNKRNAAVKELDEALAELDTQLADLKNNKRNKKARAALSSAKDSLMSAKDMLKENDHKAFQYKTNTKVMSDVMDTHMVHALKNVEEQNHLIMEMREELDIEMAEANDEMNEIMFEIKVQSESDEEREFHLKALEEVKMDMAEMEEVRLKALKNAEKNLQESRKKLEKKIAERKAAKKKKES